MFEVLLITSLNSRRWILPKGWLMPAQAKMFPRIRPHPPTVTELREHGRKFPPNHLHESWADYLYWDSELEP